MEKADSKDGLRPLVETRKDFLKMKKNNFLCFGLGLHQEN